MSCKVLKRLIELTTGDAIPKRDYAGRRALKQAFSLVSDLLGPEEEEIMLLVDVQGHVVTASLGKTELENKQIDCSALLAAAQNSQGVLLNLLPPCNDLSSTPLTLAMVRDIPLEDRHRSRMALWQKGIEDAYTRFQRYESILDGLDAIDEGISMVDRNGIVVYANQSCYDITESSPEEMLLYPMDKYTREKPVLISVLADGKSRIDFEYHLTFKEKTIHLINSAYPIHSQDGTVNGAIDVFRNIRRSRKLADDLAGYHAIYSFDSLIGEYPKLKQAISNAKTFANSDKSILIQGESGVGKELFAQSIHNFSHRSDAPFVALNCANLPSELIDSELFGYEEGAFTGARKQGKQGKFELAKGGTIFLDEIGELPIQLQAKLLRVLETKEISRIGSNRKIWVDIRILAATNQDLDGMVREGRFRADLLYRLRVLHITVPALRERQADIALLSNHFLDKIAYDLNLSRKTLLPEALALLNAYNWPGNIREFENVMYRAAYLCEGDQVDVKTLLYCGIRQSKDPPAKTAPFKEVARDHFLQTLNRNHGNKKLTAEQLGISRPTVYRLIRKFNVTL